MDVQGQDPSVGPQTGMPGGGDPSAAMSLMSTLAPLIAGMGNPSGGGDAATPAGPAQAQAAAVAPVPAQPAAMTAPPSLAAPVNPNAGGGGGFDPSMGGGASGGAAGDISNLSGGGDTPAHKMSFFDALNLAYNPMAMRILGWQQQMHMQNEQARREGLEFNERIKEHADQAQAHADTVKQAQSQWEQKLYENGWTKMPPGWKQPPGDTHPVLNAAGGTFVGQTKEEKQADTLEQIKASIAAKNEGKDEQLVDYRLSNGQTIRIPAKDAASHDAAAVAAAAGRDSKTETMVPFQLSNGSTINIPASKAAELDVQGQKKAEAAETDINNAHTASQSAIDAAKNADRAAEDFAASERPVIPKDAEAWDRKNLQLHADARQAWSNATNEVRKTVGKYPDRFEGGPGQGGYPYIKMREKPASGTPGYTPPAGGKDPFARPTAAKPTAKTGGVDTVAQARDYEDKLAAAFRTPGADQGKLAQAVQRYRQMFGRWPKGVPVPGQQQGGAAPAPMIPTLTTQQ